MLYRDFAPLGFLCPTSFNGRHDVEAYQHEALPEGKSAEDEDREGVGHHVAEANHEADGREEGQDQHLGKKPSPLDDDHARKDADGRRENCEVDHGKRRRCIDVVRDRQAADHESHECKKHKRAYRDETDCDRIPIGMHAKLQMLNGTVCDYYTIFW